MIHCGKERKSKHCPDCGALINAGAPPEDPTLKGLLAECRKQQASAEKSAGNTEGVGKALEGAAREAVLEKHVAEKEAIARRWKAWGDVLEATLQEPPAELDAAESIETEAEPDLELVVGRAAAP